MSFKTLIFFGFLAVTLGFTLTEANTGSTTEPPGAVSGSLDLSQSNSPIASIDYNYKLKPDLDVFAGASRDFKLNENSGYAGLGSKSLSGTFEHSDSMGSSASIGYKRPITDNLGFHAGASRNFGFNDNSAYAGLSSGPLSGTFRHSDSMGSSAMIDYTRPISRNLDLYAGASRNFDFNDNRAYGGLRYRF